MSGISTLICSATATQSTSSTAAVAWAHNKNNSVTATSTRRASTSGSQMKTSDGRSQSLGVYYAQRVQGYGAPPVPIPPPVSLSDDFGSYRLQHKSPVKESRTGQMALKTLTKRTDRLRAKAVALQVGELGLEPAPLLSYTTTSYPDQSHLLLKHLIAHSSVGGQAERLAFRASQEIHDCIPDLALHVIRAEPLSGTSTLINLLRSEAPTGAGSEGWVGHSSSLSTERQGVPSSTNPFWPSVRINKRERLRGGRASGR